MWESFCEQIKSSTILLNFRDICNLAQSHRALHRQLSPIRDRCLWNARLDSSHKILIKARSMLRCVEKGDFLLSYCGKPIMWCKTSSKIDLEDLITSPEALELYNYKDRKRSVCDHTYEGANGEICILTRPAHLSQHSYSYWQTLTRQEDNNQNWLNPEGFLTSSSSAPCQCLHCVTIGELPDECCDCPQCTDPKTGVEYYSKRSCVW